jgi:hypothetical protein
MAKAGRRWRDRELTNTMKIACFGVRRTIEGVSNPFPQGNVLVMLDAGQLRINNAQLHLTLHTSAKENLR